MTTFDDYRLGDRYTNDDGKVFLTGIQALVRLPIEQLRADRLAGLTTAAFLSGYPGSPLGGFDQEMVRAAKAVPELPIVVQPGVNEELGATAVMGSQLAPNQPDCAYDGILGIWYGKAPGFDRAGDALRHAVFAGTSRYGGAIALVGDDPAAKSSTLPTSSDATMVDLHMPILYPGDVQEALDLGRHAVAMSRATGLWASMKIVAAVADGTGTVDLAPSRTKPVIPDLTIDGLEYQHRPNGNLITPFTLDMEREFRQVRIELLKRYATANRLNRVTVDPPDAWIGLMSSGYTYHELLEVLRRLGLDGPEAIRGAGIRLMQMQMPVPFDPDKVRSFARGLEEIVVIEEKNATLERLVRDALYGGPDQPRVVGKTNPDGSELMRNYDILDADAIIGGLRARLAPRLEGRLTPLPVATRERVLIPLETSRIPYFCSGCPHNHGTKVPEGALVGAGIGCHGMVLFMPEEKVGELSGIAAMGGEGLPWVGMAPFVERKHFIQNLGDGTFFHSGQLAVQAAVAAGVNITYKLLYNGTVAMTGGQDASGGVGVPQIATILLAHGVSRVLVTTDDPKGYDGRGLPRGVEVWNRTRIVEAQEMLSGVKGVTVLINDQACAAQSRRLRKKGLVETPPMRVVINHRICEGCGDCGEVSNCLSVQPLDTPLGIKTTIDQTTCNLDFSCLDGDCPSFMTVEGGGPADGRSDSLPVLPELSKPPGQLGSDPLSIRLAGIGGTGVVTVAQIIGTAAMLDGSQVRGLDQTGLSQKAGPVVSDLRLTRGEAALSNLVGEGGADVIVAFDLLVGADDATLEAATSDRTVVVASTTPTPTGSMIGHPEVAYPGEELLIDRVEARTRSGSFVDAGEITRSLFGVTTSANIFLLGIAVQQGVIPISPASIDRAIELNGVAVETNVAAFAYGRAWAVDASLFSGLERSGPLASPRVEVVALPSELKERAEAITTVDSELLTMLAADLVGHTNAAYARRYLSVIEGVSACEVSARGDGSFAEAAARGLHKVMAYKDEYEVARLILGPEGVEAARRVGGPGAKLTYRLHPPMLRSVGMESKLRLPAWLAEPAMRALARGKRLRGTALDPFGRAELRRTERALIGEYESLLDELAGRVEGGIMATTEAAEVAALVMDVRGYEDLKERRIGEFREAVSGRLGRLG